MLPAPIAVQGFEPIARRSAQIVELFGRVDGKKSVTYRSYTTTESGRPGYLVRRKKSSVSRTWPTWRQRAVS